MSMRAPRGTVDILPEDVKKWQYVERVLRNLAHVYNYEEIRTPMFEHTEVFERSVGDTTDIVQKEMYTFRDRANRSLTLRPEGTAPVVRSFVQHKMHGLPNQPVKLYYFSEMFRYERPQQGRMRQLHQFGVEVLGSADPAVDAEVISLAMHSYEKFGLTSLKLVINSLGDRKSRKHYRQILIDHFTPHVKELCDDCQKRINENPLRILDCKKDMDHPAMGDAPSILDHLNEPSREYFEQVKKYLTKMNIEFEVDSKLVRGLDYYNHTAFEIMSEAKGFGAQTTLLGGGRYDGLTEELGGPDVPGIGFGMGLERLLLALDIENISLPIEKSLDCFIVSLGEASKTLAVSLAYDLRKKGIQVDQDYLQRGMRAQFRQADRFKTKYVMIIGDDEIAKQAVTLRDMKTGDQYEVSINDVVKHLVDETLGG